ncbi:alkaline phosphatase PhoX [Micromonospora sp. M12]
MRAGTWVSSWPSPAPSPTAPADRPLGTWLTCEETEDRAGDTWEEGGRSGVYQKDHGYVFEVWADGSADPKPIKCLGRYSHEALAVDRDRTRVYLSEDADEPNGLFYRWTAPHGVKVGPGVLTRLAPNAGVLAAMQIILDDGSVLPDVAYLTSAQLAALRGPVDRVPDRRAHQVGARAVRRRPGHPRTQVRGRVGNRRGRDVVNSYAWDEGDLPADAAPHDGMVWFYNYRNQTIQLVTYFPHQTASEEGAPVKYTDLTFDGPDNVTVTPWKPRARRGRHGRLARAQHDPGRPDLRDRPQPAQRLGVLRADLHGRRQGALRQHAGPGLTLAITGPWEKYLG